jgi:hypothetical protein
LIQLPMRKPPAVAQTAAAAVAALLRAAAAVQRASVQPQLFQTTNTSAVQQ